MSWSAKQYLSFEDERTRPVRDLLSALPAMEQARFVIDVGCGPGNSTEVLAARFPNAAVQGFDSSPDMIAAARRRLPRVEFSIADVEEWAGLEEPAVVGEGAGIGDGAGVGACSGVKDRHDAGGFDVILANAVLQWVPNHARLLPALVAKLAPGGVLAIQMPDNLDDPAHGLMREVAAEGPWANSLAAASASRTPLADASWYYELLRPGCAKVDVWRTTYHHALQGGAGAIVEWFKGSGLRPFLEPLDARWRAAYLDRYAAAVVRAYPALSDGSVLLPFPRLFVAATRVKSIGS
jgi:trans-aconitate 2-methyltransferase